MNPLKTTLKPGVSYTETGNFFSRFFLLQANIQQHGSILLITEDEYSVKQYKKLCEYFEVPFFMMEQSYEYTYLQNATPWIYCIDIESTENKTLQTHACLAFEIWQKNGLLTDIESLTQLGYTFSEYGKKGSYKKQWDTLHIYDFSWYFHHTLSYWGDEVEAIQTETLRGEKVIDSNATKSLLLGKKSPLIHDNGDISLQELLQKTSVFTVFDTVEFYSWYKNLVSLFQNTVSFDIIGDNSRNKTNLEISELQVDTLDGFTSLLQEASFTTYIYTKRTKLIDDFLKYNEIHSVEVIEVQNNFLKSFQKTESQQNKKWVRVICDDIISRVFIKKRITKKLSEDIDLLLKIKKWDYIIHIDHGVWIFHEIVKKQLWKVEKEYVEIHYKENDKLFVPITEVSRISKYIWKDNPSLTPLAGKAWEKKMAKVREDIREIAEELLTTFAQRKLRPGIPYYTDTSLMDRFQQKFPYSYTGCQESAVEDILKDMSQDTTMDRLLVWDVGFGKTEVAFNAIYNAITNKKQVVFIAPLVVLAYEHYEKALERFEEMGVKIAVLTRMESQKNVTQVLKWLKEWTIDLVIGTHRLLGKNVAFKDLWLIVIDEEHKFGVTDKEKIKVIKSEIDVLSMSATPIPRSLNLALSGVRNISILKTPPEGRKNIETYISPYEEKVIQDAGKKEFARGWQVFFVHNRVVNIEVYKKNLEKLFPGKKIVITHGQLPWDELENRIIDFKHKKYDILLSTTVIENGIDFSNVNTIFINECQSFGISQLHQLRWRVGRSDKKGYCYLLYRKEILSNESAKRLQTIVNYSYLWAGFELAMKDLEIRGSGDILGIRQSGQVQEIGINLFLKMLEEKIQELREQKQWIKPEPKLDMQVDLQISASIPDEYFQSESDKIHFYREIESLSHIDELDMLIAWFKDVNPDIPESTQNLFTILHLKLLGQKYFIQSIKKVGIHYQVDFKEQITLPELKEFLALDKEVHFHVVDIKRLRASTKLFENDKKFLQYLTCMLEKKVWNPKIKLKAKK